MTIQRARHGTRASYVRYRCRCQECRRANWQYERERRGPGTGYPVSPARLWLLSYLIENGETAAADVHTAALAAGFTWAAVQQVRERSDIEIVARTGQPRGRAWWWRLPEDQC